MCCIGSADVSIVFKPERLENAISVEGIHGTPEGSKVKLDGYCFICICQVYTPVYIFDHSPQSIISDGVPTGHGFQVSKTRRRVDISPPSYPASKSVWYPLSIDPNGRAYMEENLLTRPPMASVFSMRDTSISREI